MVVIGRGQPVEAKLNELPKGTLFKFLKGEGYVTYIKMSNFAVSLSTGTYYADSGSLDCYPVFAYKNIKVITKPMTKSVEISKIPCGKLNAGECCLYEDTAYIKTDIDAPPALVPARKYDEMNDAWVVMLNLETKKLHTFETNDKVLPAPFLCLELM